jgi:hypothetical protein
VEKIKYDNIKQEAERLGVRISWLYQQVRKKGEDRFPHVKAGKYLRFVPEWSDAHLKKQSERQ